MSAGSNVSNAEQQTVEQLFKSLQALQLQNQALAQENRELKVSSTPLPSSDSASGQAGAKSSKKDTNSLEGLLTPAEIKDVQSKARALVVGCNIWWDRFKPFGYARVQSTKELVLYRKQLEELNKKVGVESKISTLRVIEAIYAAIPESFHDMVENAYPVFVQTISLPLIMTDAATGLRSTLMHNIKKNTFWIFDDIPVPHQTFLPSASRGTDDLCLSLLGYDKIKNKYKQCPKILYPIGEGDEASSQLFQLPAMIKVLSIILYGASSLQAGKPTRSTNGRIWQMDAITPGAIACAAIIVRYLLSADGTFQKEGDKSSIPYSYDLDYYIRIIESTAMLTSTKRTLNFYNQNLFSRKKIGAGPVISATEKESDSEEEEILRALRQPNMDREMEVNTSLEDNGESTSATLMPLPTLRVIRAASPPATRRNYIEVHSDDEPHPTDIFATSSDDESVAAIIANALGHRNSPVSDNSGTEPGDSPGMASNASDNALPDTVNAPKPSRGRGRGRAAKKTGGGGTHSGTRTKGGSKAGASGSGSVNNAPAPKKASGGHQLRSRVQVPPVDADARPGAAAEAVYDLDEMSEEDLEYGAA
ncbi:uncharacterized protein ARMOST_12533 [Armillaria ostoyae]|uniref:Uncharacterized protein n=1 Tax=Armillaria ostoyae TaxID=47428 RepID=A0A284RKA4_ARMOS|nr:uncharacterized protein ARMOST_12533 [Armillaria ostoyae]